MVYRILSASLCSFVALLGIGVFILQSLNNSAPKGKQLLHLSNTKPAQQLRTPTFHPASGHHRSGGFRAQLAQVHHASVSTHSLHPLFTGARLAVGMATLMAASWVLAIRQLYQRPVPKQTIVAFAASGEKNPQDDPQKPPEAEKKMSIGGLVQLVLAGAGAPFLGELKEVAFDDPTKPDLTFELEANNLTDAEGNTLQTKNPYFTDGWVDKGEDKGPGFFENLLSGGKLQREFDERKGSE